MGWLGLAVAALGGGLVAAFVESWFSYLRAFETACLQVLDDLDSINAFSQTMKTRVAGITQAETAQP